MRIGEVMTMPEYIEREALRKSLLIGAAYLDEDTMMTVVNVLDCFPSADVAPVRHGRIVGSLEDGRYRRRFSCCGEDATMITQWARPKYCPNCGCRMDG